MEQELNFIGIYLNRHKYVDILLFVPHPINKGILNYEVRVFNIFGLRDFEKYDLIDIKMVEEPGKLITTYTKIHSFPKENSEQIMKTLIDNNEFEIIKNLRNKKIDRILNV